MSIPRLAAVIVLALSAPLALCATDAPKEEAIARPAARHDPAIPVAIGRIHIKQVRLQTARALLAEHGRIEGPNPSCGQQAPERHEGDLRLSARVDDFIVRRTHERSHS